jgi:hypothetical protein
LTAYVKAAIEAAVHVTENWILAPLRKRQFFSLAEANAAVAEQLAIVNHRPFRGQPVSRRALFEELERDALQPLPRAPYELATWKSAKVNIDRLSRRVRRALLLGALPAGTRTG